MVSGLQAFFFFKPSAHGFERGGGEEMINALHLFSLSFAHPTHKKKLPFIQM